MLKEKTDEQGCPWRWRWLDVMSGPWYVYILRCADGSLYTGVARDLQRRLLQHNGKLAGGSRYTRGRRPVELVWSDTESSRSAAQRREASIKKLRRDEKLLLLQLWAGC